MKSLDELAAVDRFRGSIDFSRLALLVMKADGQYNDALEMAMHNRSSDRVVTALKAASSTGTLTSLGPDFGILSSAFISSFGTSGAFDSVRANGALALALDTPAFRAVSTAAFGDTPGEGLPAVISSIHVVPGVLSTAWAHAIFVLTAEVLEQGASGVLDLVSRELRNAAIAAADRAFLATMVINAPSVVASADMLADLTAAADEMDLDTSARLVAVMPSASVRHLALQTDTTGARILPELAINGGAIAGVRIVASDHIPVLGSPDDPTALLLDASQIAVADGALEMDIVRHASLQLTDDPQTGAQQVVNLWQTNSRAIRIRRRIGFAKLRETAAAVITAVAW